MGWPKPLRVLWMVWAFLWFIVTTLYGVGGVHVLSWLGASEDRCQGPARAWARWLTRGIGCPVRLIGEGAIQPGQPYVFASNHTSMLDILALMSVLPQNFRWIAKQELFGIPFFGPAMARAGYIPIDRSNQREAMKSLIRASRRIAEGVSVVVFPEGTRTPDGRLLPFKSGGFGLALNAKVPVVPLAILGARRALPKGSLLLSPGPITVMMGEPLPVEALC